MLMNSNISYQLPGHGQYFFHDVLGGDESGKCEHSCHLQKCCRDYHDTTLGAKKIERQVEEREEISLYWSM